MLCVKGKHLAMEASMANEASCIEIDRRASPLKAKVGAADAHARAGDAVGVARKIEKVVHYGAFWCVACATVAGGPQHVVFARRLEGCAAGEKASHRGSGTKNSKSDAKRCILMHGGRATLNRTRILRVGWWNDASFMHQKMVHVMHGDARKERAWHMGLPAFANFPVQAYQDRAWRR